MFAEKWDAQYPSISRSWRNHWVNIILMFSFLPEMREVMYTTNAYAFGGAKLYESLNMCLQKVTKNHRIFPNNEAALKVMYLAINSLAKKWTMPFA